MYQFSVVKHHAYLGIYKWGHMKRFLFCTTVLFGFQSTTTFFKSYLCQIFRKRSVLLGECQLYKVLSLLMLQVQFDDDSSVLLGKFDLPNI